MNKVCFLIPVYNEEVLIQRTINSLKTANVEWEHVYIVNDGSKDKTVEKLLEIGFPESNIFTQKNQGKSLAIQSGFDYFKLAKRYEWVAFLDGDSIVDKTYGRTLEKTLRQVGDPVVAVCGHVKTDKTYFNLFTAYRALEYFLTHFIYKKAQGKINVITVLPGCSSVIRSNVLVKLLEKLDTTILTEDMHWTIRIHIEKLGKIIFAEDLVVYTQDPRNLANYFKQVRRWYRGLWQVYLKEKLWKPITKVSGELNFLLWEGVIYSFGFILSVGYTLLHLNTIWTNWFLITDIILYSIYCLSAMLYQKDWKLCLFFPFFYVLRLVNCFVLLLSAFEIVVLRTDKLSWNKVERYDVGV